MMSTGERRRRERETAAAIVRLQAAVRGRMLRKRMVDGVREKYAAIFGEIEGLTVDVEDLFAAPTLSKPRDRAAAEIARACRLRQQAEDAEREARSRRRGEAAIRSLESLSIDTSVSWEFERERRDASKAAQYGRDADQPGAAPSAEDGTRQQLRSILDTSTLRGSSALALAVELKRIREAMAARVRDLERAGGDERPAA